MSSKLGERPSPKKTLRRLVEFRGINRVTLQQYRKRIRHLYDGPAGAVLAFGSKLCLHEPLVGRILSRRKFDVSGCRCILDVGAGAGQILGHLLKRTHRDTTLIAFDLSHRMLRRAKQRLHKIGRASCRERVCMEWCRSRWSPYHSSRRRHTRYGVM